MTRYGQIIDPRPDRLNQLVEDAHKRKLTSNELRELTRLAKRAGENRIREIVVSFVGAGSIACQNLVRARSLRHMYATVSRRNINVASIQQKELQAKYQRPNGKKIKVTAHAAERYIQRINPDVTIDEAIEIIEKEARTAIRSKTKSRRTKNEIWITESGYQIIVKRDGGGLTPVAATVVPKNEELISELPPKDGPRTRKILKSVK